MKKLIQYKSNKSSLSIRIPLDFLAFVAKNHPEWPVKVLNKEEFGKQVLFQLENNLGNHESLTGFQELLDEAISEAHNCNGDFSEDMEIE